MYKCPNCGEVTITKFDKFMLGPARTIRCSNCNARVSVTWWSWILFVAILSGAMISKRKTDPGMFFIGVSISMGIYLYVHMRMPLKNRDKKLSNM